MGISDPNLYIDIHTHSYNHCEGVIQIINLFPEQVIKQLPARSVIELKSSVFYSLGWHPWYLTEENYDSFLKIVSQECLRPEILAIGECGLDHQCYVPFQLQQKVFKQQALIAERVEKPLLIHCVRASNEIIKLKKEIKPKMPWIIHGYNSNLFTGRELIRHGFYLSLGFDLLKEASNALRILPEIPLDRLFFETGDLDVAVEKVYQKAALLLNIALLPLVTQIDSNFNRVFHGNKS
jgi:TatD DNase family protein